MDIAIIIIIGVLFLVLVGVLLFGMASVGWAILNNLWILMAVVLVAVILFGLWFIFVRKPPVSVGALLESQVMESCKAGKDEFMAGCWIAGNKNGSGKFLGNIIGKISVPVKTTVGGKDVVYEQDGIKTWSKAGGMEITATAHALLLRETGLIASLLGKKRILWVFDFLDEVSHSPFVGEVELYSDCMVKHGRFWFLGHQVNNEIVERVMALESLRITTNLALDHMHDIMVRSLNANPDLEADKRNKQQLPFNLFGNNNRPQVAEPIQ